MPIIRGPRKTEKFTIVSNTIIEDTRLSFKARGVLIYILSKPDNWVVRVEQIAKANGCGRDSLQSALREIEAAGYLTRTKTRNPQGQWVHVQTISEIPVLESNKPKA